MDISSWNGLDIVMISSWNIVVADCDQAKISNREFSLLKMMISHFFEHFYGYEGLCFICAFHFEMLVSSNVNLLCIFPPSVLNKCCLWGNVWSCWAMCHLDFHFGPFLLPYPIPMLVNYMLVACVSCYSIFYSFQTADLMAYFFYVTYGKFFLVLFL